MPHRPSATDSSSEREAAGGGYFGPLASARYVLLTTLEPDGTQESTAVQAVLDGNRAYFRAWSRSGIAKRLRRTAAVQVSPCTALGLCSFGAPFDAAVRLLPGGQASGVAGKLADKYPLQQRLLIPLRRRMRRGQMMHYELLAPGAATSPGVSQPRSRPLDGLRQQKSAPWSRAHRPNGWVGSQSVTFDQIQIEGHSRAPGQ